MFADVEQVSGPQRYVDLEAPWKPTLSWVLYASAALSVGQTLESSMAKCLQEDEEPPASAANVASSSAAPAASSSAVKSAGPTPQSLREEDEAFSNADSNGDDDAEPSEDTLARLLL